MLLASAVIGASCGDDGPGSPPTDAAVGGITVPDGYTVTEVLAGLERPTQFEVQDDGSIVAAQLGGGENDGVGEIVRVDPTQPGAPPTVLYDRLQKPTGVAVLGDELWVMEARRLSRGPLDGGELEVVLDELPFNGRSEGTLTATGDGRLLYNTSGTISGDRAADGSGILWSLTPDAPPEALATGFKNAYARTFAADGTLWQTEVADGNYDGEPAPDELVAMAPGASGVDFGWPACVGDNRPIALYGGSAERCADVPASHAVFEFGATPTSVVVAPWDPAMLLVALWNAGQVVAVPTERGAEPVAPEIFASTDFHPQFLVVDGGRVLLADFDAGRILAVEAA